jgi:hypothetical protein
VEGSESEIGDGDDEIGCTLAKEEQHQDHRHGGQDQNPNTFCWKRKRKEGVM